MSADAGRGSGGGATPLVSIVVPAYNRADLLPETLDSLLALDYPHVEVIVVDDGSTDATPAVVADYVRRDARVRGLRHDNRGQSASVNRGFDAARGDLLAMISSDDRQPPGLLGPLVDCLLARPEVVVAYPDWEMIDEEGRYVDTVRTLDYDFVDMVRWMECVPGPGALVRRAAVARAGGWDPSFRYCPDFEWYLRLGLVGPFARVPLPLAQWRRHGGSITVSTRGEAMARERVRAADTFFARPDLPPEIVALRGEAMRNAYILAAITVTPDLPGPGARFELVDRLHALRTQAAARREPTSETAEARLGRMDAMVREHVRIATWLHAEVAARDRTIARLEGEAVARAGLVAELRAALATRDPGGMATR